MKPPLHHTFGPHVNAAYLLRSLGYLATPWRWSHGNGNDALKRALHALFDGEVALFATAREGLVALLRAMDIAPGDEVIVQGFTCIAVPNAILAAGGTPVYADIAKETLNLDTDAVAAAVTPRTRMIIAQHTFGIPAPMQALRTLCDTRGIFLLEDCAHVLPDQHGPADVAAYGDGLLISMGRDKAISGVSGGAVVCRTDALAGRLWAEEERAGACPTPMVLRLLLYPLFYASARLLWRAGLGRVFLACLRMLGAMPAIYTESEKHGTMATALRAMPNACALLALWSLRNLRAMNDHRRTLTARYLRASADHGWPVLRGIDATMPLLKYPLFVEEASGIRTALKRKNIHLDDGWTRCVVCPASVDPGDVRYRQGCDPRAEAAASAILTLPTHPTMPLAEAERLIAELSALLSPAA